MDENGVAYRNQSGLYIDCGAIPLISDHWTIATSLRLNSISSYMRIISWGGAGPTLWNEQSTGRTAIVHSGTVDLQASTQQFFVGEKAQFVITRSGAKCRIYKNAVVIASSDAFAVSFSQDSTFRIGNSSAFNEPADARFDYVMTWQRGLAESEVRDYFLHPFQTAAMHRQKVAKMTPPTFKPGYTRGSNAVLDRGGSL
jgi:hypothetical protein